MRPRRPPVTPVRCAVFAILALSWPAVAAGEQSAEIGLAAQLRKLDAKVFPANGETANALPWMLSRDVLTRIQAATLRENTAWHEAKTRADWERLRDARIQVRTPARLPRAGL